jgi:hypothetical protein
MTHSIDRSGEDIGNIVEFGHVNICVPDQRLATLFYMTGLGLTRDPYLMTGVDNMWANAGTTQFHLPSGSAQVMGGVVVLAVPDLAFLSWRLERVQRDLHGTCFTFDATPDAVHVTCPWGNRLRCVVSPTTRLGILAVEFAVPPGTAEPIARFYREMLGSPAYGQPGRVVVPAGLASELVYIETADPIPAYDGNHVQISLADFSGPYRRLLARGLISQEDGAHQYRFQQIIDPALDDGAPLFRIEHEVRSMRHPMYARPLVNRDPRINNVTYAPGREVFVLGDEPAV